MIEVDPDNSTAIYDANGNFRNSSTVSGLGATATVTSDSDDPAIADDIDGDGDGLPDDATIFALPKIALTKSLIGIADASSGALDNLDVTYQFTLTNVGSITLDELRITDDWANNLGGAMIRVVDANLSDDTIAPAGSGIGGNANYSGGSAENLLDGAGSLAPGESVTVTLIVELDPDNPLAITNGLGGLGNRAIGFGNTPG